ncbi:MAG TPA: 4Fe-4S binding protein [Deltaproteobacteria bacterium]|jgi:NAD-dependent dihydropyrimidine dehydrogenase PreA subunit|nr:4Fe-4S binding protein [Deltaproteobacteria bacterium]HPL85702.1 4Fe-4S binding protein [Deltaproteobacteria bacterium]
MKRKIIEIDQELCNGCGQCVGACAEGALELIDGKAVLVSDVYCDGLGACIGECPTGALKIIERDAVAFDESAVERHLERSGGVQSAPPLACGCPGTAAVSFEPEGSDDASHARPASALSHFPVKLQLINPQAPFLKGADLLLMADCCALCSPEIHTRLIRNKAVAMGCPKLDDINAHIQRLADIIRHGGIRSLCVVHMEVPCCSGFVRAALAAAKSAGSDIPLRHIVISRRGEILQEGPIEAGSPPAGQGLRMLS